MFRLHHVHIVTHEIEKAGDFLHQVLGAEEVRRGGSGDNWQYRLDGTGIFLRQRRDGEELADGAVRRAGLDHLGLAVDDFEAAMAHLLRAGCVVQKGPNITPDGVNYAFLLGPGGVFLEVLRPLKS